MTAINGGQVFISGLKDSSGNPLNGGKLYTYNAGTTNHKHLYTDLACTTPATDDPFILDVNGEIGVTPIYGQGLYKLVFKTSADVTVATLDNIYYGQDYSFGPVWGGETSGSGLAYTCVCSPIISAWSAGTRFAFVTHAGCSANATISPNGLAAKSLRMNRGSVTYALQANELPAGTLVDILYDGTYAVIINAFSPDNIWTPTVTGNGDMTLSTKTFNLAKYTIIHGGRVDFAICSEITITACTTGDQMYFTLPVNTSTMDRGAVVANVNIDGATDTLEGMAKIDATNDRIVVQIGATDTVAAGPAFAVDTYYINLTGFYYLA